MTIIVKIQRNPLSVEFEVGSPSEAIGILEEHRAEWLELLAFSTALDEGDEGSNDSAPAPVPVAEATGQQPAKRGRKPKVTATAPAPAPVPAVETPAPAPVPAVETPVPAPVPDGNIPPFLKREQVAPPPPPVPSGVVANKVITALTARATDEANKKMLADWLASNGVVVPGATYDECLAVIRMTTDEKLGPVAQALSV